MGARTSQPVVPYDEVLTIISPETLALYRLSFQEITERPNTSGMISLGAFRTSIGVPFLDFGIRVVDRLFAVMDTDGNKSLSFREFVCAAFVFHSGTKRQKMRLVFNMFDVSATGSVSRADFETMAGAVLIGDSKATARVEVPNDEREEEDRDGPDTIVADIDTSALAPLEETMAAMALFGFDRDEDNKLSFEEWNHWAEHSSEIQRFVNAMDRVIPDDF